MSSVLSPEQLRHMALLHEKFPTLTSVTSEMIRIEALCRLPKGTEHFMSDLHGESEAFEHILVAPPATAYEALVFQWSYFFLSEHVDNLQVRSLGAMDILYAPLYRADLAAGRTTPDEFRRDLAYFWWQWGSVDNYWGQPVALGGTKADGTTEYNEVSDLVLDVHDELALPRRRCSSRSPPTRRSASSTGCSEWRRATGPSPSTARRGSRGP